MFKYELEIGRYDDPRKISIEMRIKEGVTPEDYATIREAFNTIESVFKKYDSPEALPTKDGLEGQSSSLHKNEESFAKYYSGELKEALDKPLSGLPDEGDKNQ